MKRIWMFLPAMAVALPALAQAPGGRQGGVPPIEVPWNDAIPAGTVDHAARALKESPRHGEWVDIKLTDGVLKAWVVYPERATKSGVVLVIHDIGGMRDMPRAVGDQLAQDGFIAIVPDFLSGKGPNGGGSESLGTGVNQAIQSLTPAEVIARLDAAMAYGRSLPASNGKTGVVGFCWGGARTFAYAAAQPALSAAVVFYGDAPGTNVAGVTEDAVAADAARNRGGHETAREELSGAHVRRRRPRLHGQPGRSGRRQPQSGPRRVAVGGPVLRKTPAVTKKPGFFSPNRNPC